MKQWINQLSKEALAAGSIILGIAFIVLVDQPYNICDSQLEVFLKSQEGFLYPRIRNDKEIKELGFKRLSDVCKMSNGPGGCLEFILGMGKVAREIQSVPNECQAYIMQESAVSRSIWKTMDLLVRIAWGEEPPTSIYSKTAWLSEVDIKLFCDLKTLVKSHYNEDEWYEYRDKYFKELPGVKKLSRQVAWEKILISTPCSPF